MTHAPPPSRRRARTIAFVGASLLSAAVTLLPPTVHASAPVMTANRTAATASGNSLPKLNVTDVRSGKATPLRGVVDGKKALLVWFWAPH